MPELSDSTPPVSPPPGPRRPIPEPPPESPPKAVTSEWEQWEGFRFTFLRYFTPEDVAALRGVAQLLYSMHLSFVFDLERVCLCHRRHLRKKRGGPLRPARHV